MANRIVSLIPSGTEIVAALGHGADLVGRSHECDFPPSVGALAVCSAPRIDVEAGSREIDQQVRAAVQQALSLYTVLLDQVERLRPTHIVTQAQCEVCAVNLKEVEQAICQMVHSRPQVVSLKPMDLADIWIDIMRVADALEDRRAGERLVRELQGRLEAVSRLVPPDVHRPGIACLEWLAPLMSAGNWVPELVELAGGRPVLCERGKHSPYVSWDDLSAADPDIIVIMPCGFGIARTMTELPVLTRAPEWRRLRAVQSGRVYVTDGHQYFNRPGPRVVESAEILCELIRDAQGEEPKSVQTRHLGSGWLRLEEC